MFLVNFFSQLNTSETLIQCLTTKAHSIVTQFKMYGIVLIQPRYQPTLIPLGPMRRTKIQYPAVKGHWKGREEKQKVYKVQGRKKEDIFPLM